MKKKKRRKKRKRKEKKERKRKRSNTFLSPARDRHLFATILILMSNDKVIPRSKCMRSKLAGSKPAGGCKNVKHVARLTISEISPLPVPFEDRERKRESERERESGGRAGTRRIRRGNAIERLEPRVEHQSARARMRERVLLKIPSSESISARPPPANLPPSPLPPTPPRLRVSLEIRAKFRNYTGTEGSG